jgi:hypothetical protein
MTTEGAIILDCCLTTEQVASRVLKSETTCISSLGDDLKPHLLHILLETENV